MSEIEIEFQNFQKDSNFKFLHGNFNSRTAMEKDFYECSEFDQYLENVSLDVNDFINIEVLDNLNIPRVRNSAG